MPTKKVTIKSEETASNVNAFTASNVNAFTAKLSRNTLNALKSDGVTLYDLVKEFSTKGVKCKAVETPKSNFNSTGIMFTAGENVTFLSTSVRLSETGFTFGETREDVAETYQQIKNDMKVRLTTSKAGNERFTLCADSEDLL